jgi:hypothetical protein
VIDLWPFSNIGDNDIEHTQKAKFARKTCRGVTVLQCRRLKHCGNGSFADDDSG